MRAQLPDLVRLLLFLGLVAHKAVWEILKRADRPERRAAVPVLLRLVKALKIGVLAFLLVQTLFLEVLPIAATPGRLQVLGGALYLLGLATAIAARVQLGRNWLDLESFDVLPSQTIVDRGIYRYVRHPIYTGDLLLVTGLELALNSWLVLAAVPLAAFVVRQVLAEETLLARTLPSYARYCAGTKRFIPFVV
ncbi:MAG TPA: isoprenylcysteine carboxylmethyltransferase family protein [Methylomirabilota bacterium]|nr:isoprenylcysteine carboxylmethyltransferase family protein [Methylomirabilota bacterium]